MQIPFVYFIFGLFFFICISFTYMIWKYYLDLYFCYISTCFKGRVISLSKVIKWKWMTGLNIYLKKIGAFPGINQSWVCSLVVYRSRRMLSICTAFPNILLEAYFLIWLYLVKLLYDYSVFCMQCHKTCRCYYIAGISSPPPQKS